jgi:integron integrase
MSQFIDTLRNRIRVKHLAYKTEQAYVDWAERFIRFHKMQHPSTMDTSHLETFIIHLANGNCSPSTQNQAIAAIKFMFREMTTVKIGDVHAMMAKRETHVPTVLSPEEVKEVMCHLHDVYHIIAQLLYGGGLRLMECMRLRVKDIDFDNRTITLRNTKSNRDRVTVLPSSAIEPLRLHMAKVKAQHDQDISHGYGSVEMPGQLAKKYPQAQYEWGWQYVFPASKLSRDPRSGIIRRHHLFETSVQKAVRNAARGAGISKPVGPHTFRHSFATHLLQKGTDIRKIQELLGHKDLKTTMIYTHVSTTSAGIVSPADLLDIRNPVGF